jgi:heme-degrading monooxygenase HmoA
MATLTHSMVSGLKREQYDQIAAVLIDKLKATSGFIAHYAWESEGGIHVVEIWDSAEQHDDWFDNNVRPHLPSEVTPQKHELINKVTA